MPNRCEGCSGRGYVGPLRPNLPQCQVCKGTGKGHVHDWKYLGVLPHAPTAIRECDGCASMQATHVENLAEVKHVVVGEFYGQSLSYPKTEFKFPQAYLAIADVTWAPCTEWEVSEIRAAKRGRP